MSEDSNRLPLSYVPKIIWKGKIGDRNFRVVAKGNVREAAPNYEATSAIVVEYLEGFDAMGWERWTQENNVFALEATIRYLLDQPKSQEG